MYGGIILSNVIQVIYSSLQRTHLAWQMLGLLLYVTLNVSERHLADDALLVEQVLVASTVFIEQRSKNGFARRCA